jgi:rhodanese-related sulfurtransferase
MIHYIIHPLDSWAARSEIPVAQSSARKEATMKTLTLDETRAALTDPRTVVLEVLPRKYYDHGHLPGARQTTNDEIGAQAKDLIPDKTTPVVVYCSGPTCGNSHAAGESLTALGYTQVGVFVGGKAAWTEAGLALERNAA